MTALTNFTSAKVHFFYFTFSPNAGSVKTGLKDEEEFEKEDVELNCINGHCNFNAYVLSTHAKRYEWPAIERR